jgi:hypothetical protein
MALRRVARPEDEVLRLNIGARWVATDFVEVFREMQFLYDVSYLASSDLHDHPEIARLRESLANTAIYHQLFQRIRVRTRIHSTVKRLDEEKAELTILRIEYASPGACDLTGAGRAIRELRLFVMGIVDRYLEREDREIAREAARQRVIKMKLNNIELARQLAKKANLGHESFDLLVHQIMRAETVIERKAEADKITGVE